MSDTSETSKLRQLPPNDAELEVAIRRELDALKRLGLGGSSLAQLLDAAPTIWVIAERTFPTTSGMSVQPLRDLLSAAARLCQPAVRGLASADLLGVGTDTFSKTLEVRREAAGKHFQVTTSTFRQTPSYEGAVLDELAACLLHLARLPGLHRARSKPRSLLHRHDLLARLAELRDRGVPRVQLWGEPGVGKTWLLDDFLQQTGLRPVLRLTLRSDFQRDQDLLTALLAEGVDGSRLPPHEAAATLRHVLATTPRSAVLVIDDMDDERQLEGLVDFDTECLVPIYVVSRHRFELPDFEYLHVADLDNDEAVALCRSRGADQGAEEIVALCRVLGNRPLALDQAIGFLRRTGGDEIGRLTRAIGARAATTMDGVARTLRARRNLTTLYQEVISRLSEDALDCLDWIVWLSDHGRMGEDLIRLCFTASSAVPQDVAHVGFAATLSQLEDLSLIRIEKTPNRGREIVVHLFTWEILCELRAVSAQQTLTAYTDTVLIRFQKDAGESGTTSDRIEGLGRHIAIELEVAAQLTQEEAYKKFGMALALSNSTWLHVGRGEDDSGDIRRIITVQASPDSGTLSWISEHGEVPFTLQEAREFLIFVREYSRRLKLRFEKLDANE